MSEIITFYSYKGGVGRTMALANVSVVLAKWGHKVLVVDWDLEAPGLEHFYKDYVDVNLVQTKTGVVDLLIDGTQVGWQDCIVEIEIGSGDSPIQFISSGKRDDEYFKRVRSFDVDEFYKNDGGLLIEKWRDEWLAQYDYILIDSRTGITEIGGICTIQLPDTVVMLFTATNHGFDGVLDIIKRAGNAQQKLPYDRQKLIFLPIPSKFDANTEFKLSQQWLEKFASELEPTYNDWLPTSVNRKDFLELTKIPYIPYFSFGEKLPVIEQGVKDPSGLGYAYESIAVLIANHLVDVEMLANNRDYYVAKVNRFYVADIESRKNGNGVDIDKKLRILRQKLNINEEIIKVKKDKKVMLECLKDNIAPFIEIVLSKVGELNNLFKNTDASISVYYTDFVFEMEDKSYSKRFASMGHFIEWIDDRMDKSNSFELESLQYFLSFSGLRNTTEVVSISMVIRIDFHDNSYELKSSGFEFTVDKLYHEVITVEEGSEIANSIMLSILSKIEGMVE